MRAFLILFVFFPALSFAGEVSLDAWLRAQEAKSWGYLQAVISPAEPKHEGGAKPLPGIVIAAPSKRDPDYYFHWTRDSSTVMSAVAKAFAAKRLYLRGQGRWKIARDYLELSALLQKAPGRFGMGEPRYNVDGSADTIPWSRPQFDGPALRALTTLEFLEALPPGPTRRLALRVLKTDLDFVNSTWRERGFDLWEELKAENYHARLVQLAALEKGAAFFGKKNQFPIDVKAYRASAGALAKLLDDHWDPTRNFLRSQLAIVETDGYTAKQTDLDAAVIVAVADSGRVRGGHSVMDPKVHATVHKLEQLFRGSFPLNRENGEPSLGLAYGRYAGDVYYGGNPFVMITADFARFYFRFAGALEKEKLAVTRANLAFLTELLPEAELSAGMVIAPGEGRGFALRGKLKERGDSILRRLRAHTPESGQLHEQFHKESGAPASAFGLGWSHASLIAAALERAKL